MVKYRTFEEITALKNNWVADPCWDIEDTEGFEMHYLELQIWRVEYERKQSEHEDRRIDEKAKMLGCSPALVVYIETLERRISELSKKEAV